METALPVVAFVPACTRNGCRGGASSLALVPPFPFPSPISVRTSSSRRGQLQLQSRRFGSLRPVIVSAAENPTSTSAERWLLEPIGDGDCKHIGFRIPLPNSFELASNTVTVGRVPEKADLVIPIATVSGLHARLEKKAGFLLVKDLDSTNGTFIDDKKLRPGVVATVSPGSSITFGTSSYTALAPDPYQYDQPYGYGDNSSHVHGYPYGDYDDSSSSRAQPQSWDDQQYAPPRHSFWW